MGNVSTHATSLIKALRVLLALESSVDGRGVSEIARSLGLPKSAVHRLLVTFRDYGFVQQSAADSRYTLGPTVARLGLRAADMFTPRGVARPYLKTLADRLGETIFLGVLDAHEVLVVDKVERGQVLRISPQLGVRLPLFQTALGKVLAAYAKPAEQARLVAICAREAGEANGIRQSPSRHQELEAIARQGVAISLEEWTDNVCCLAAPIFNSRGDVVAAVAVTLPRSRLPHPQRHDPFAGGNPLGQYPALLPPLVETARHISTLIP